MAEPMFDLSLFRIRAFAAGCVATLLAAIGRGGLQFILIIWLQGIWLPPRLQLRADAALSQALNVAFTFALVACLIAAGASLLRGGRYHHDDHAAVEGGAVEPIPSGIAPALQRAS